MNRIEMIERIGRANAEIARLFDWIDENIGAFKSHNLKLYDALYYTFDAMENDFPLICKEYQDSKSDIFYQFCADSYDQFAEWMNEQGIDERNIFKHIGRTSSFHIYNKGLVEYDVNHGIDYSWIVSNAVDDLSYTYSGLSYTDTGYIDADITFEDFEDNIGEINYIIDSLYDDFTYALEDTVKVYDYIKEFKDNQVAYFKEYCEYREEDLRYEQEQEEKSQIEYEECRVEDLINIAAAAIA